MGAQISLSTSRHLPPGFHVPPNAVAALMANGWQPPPNPQEPTGSFLLPKGGPMKLTRHQADLVLRHYTAEYAKEVSEEPEFWQAPEFATFVRELQWRIDADLSRNHTRWLVAAWPTAFQKIEGAENDVNFEANEALDSAGFRGPHILRYSVPVSA